jgi:hypothetical protein
MVDARCALCTNLSMNAFLFFDEIDSKAMVNSLQKGVVWMINNSFVEGINHCFAKRGALWSPFFGLPDIGVKIALENKLMVVNAITKYFMAPLKVGQ